jgi:dGTP triphosphohydrolase
MELKLFGLSPHEDLSQLVCDYIACMTDDMALETYIQVFVPKRIA